MKKLNLDLFFGFFILIVLIILKYKALSLPYFWDGLNYMIPTIDYLYKNTLTIFLWNYNLGHPPFFFLLVGALFKLFGDSQIVANSVVLFFSFLTLIFTYLIGKNLFNRKIGIIASLLLLFTPIFFSYSALLFLAMPLTALTVMSIYFFIKDNKILYFIFGSLTVLTETTGILLIIALTLVKIIEQKKFNKNVVYYASPILIFLAWVISNKVYYGHFLYPVGTSLVNISIVKNLLNLMMVLKTLFFDQYRWILTSIFFLSFIKYEDLKKVKTKRLLIYIFLSLIALILFYNISIFTGNLNNSYPNIEDYFNIVKNFSLLFSIIFFIILVSYKKIISTMKDKKFIPLLVLLIVLILAHVLIIPFAPRYLLFAFPIIYLIYAFSLERLFKSYSIYITILIILIFFLNFYGERDTIGFTLETNMEYADMIKTHQMAASYIEDNFKDMTVLAAYPQSLELQYDFGKYVKEPIKVITVPPFPGVTEYSKNYNLFFNSTKDYSINISEVDIYYYSKQEYNTTNINDAVKNLNLTLLKRFEINNKVTEIYLVNK